MPDINKEDFLKRITVDPKIMVGKPVIRGYRITVEQIMEALASGVSVKDILEDYPFLEEDDIKAVLVYATELIKEEKVFAVTPL